MSRRVGSSLSGIVVALIVAGCWGGNGDGKADHDGDAVASADAVLDGSADGGPTDADATDTSKPPGDVTGEDSKGAVEDVRIPDVDGEVVTDSVGHDPMCMEDSECPGNAVCRNGSCRYYRFVQIKDVTRQNSSSAQTACSEKSSGADLFELELRGPFGVARGYSKALAAKLTSQENKKVQKVFDGVSNSVMKQPNGAVCPSGGFQPDSVVSLGCGGTMAMAFTDGGGNIVNLADGQKLVIHEYGQQCCSGGCPEDFWEVSVCTAQVPGQIQGQKPDGNGNFPTCKKAALSMGTGKGEVRITLPAN